MQHTRHPSLSTNVGKIVPL
uniref:Uncharacterized protein n=1 Tax=Arundo donax TaxID=35708 RepID=A0A0A9C626_ARUDO